MPTPAFPNVSQVRGVRIRVLNNSDYDFQNLVVNDVSFGSLRKYRGSDYHELNGAYHYGAVSFEVNDKTFRQTPIDYIGETPLSPGRYTYMVSIDYETGAMHTTFFEGDRIPKGEQAQGRNRILNIKRVGRTPRRELPIPQSIASRIDLYEQSVKGPALRVLRISHSPPSCVPVMADSLWPEIHRLRPRMTAISG